ncbi:tyrosine-type recombinase/integrase [Marinobacter sp.]|uniref:tyrosine-type recombinase/integrase n=1 Tax=Marinobacter sp. TaxID=50741 RepID=UPI003563F892
MYLQRSSHAVYYSRIPVPRKWHRSGFPHTVRISLRTKSRSEALKLNARVTHAVLELFEKDSTFRSIEVFNQAIDAVRIAPPLFIPSAPVLSPASRSSKASQRSTRNKRQTSAILIQEFIKHKKAEGSCTERYLAQLFNRLKPFGVYLDQFGMKGFGPKQAVGYRDDLVARTNWAPKTVNEHVSVARQFIAWCESMEYITRNPFARLRLKVADDRKDIDQRVIWTGAQLEELFNAKPFQGVSGLENRLIASLQLKMGLRPSEACQIRCEDVAYDEAHKIWYLKVTDAGPQQHLKTLASKRNLPLPNSILDIGFLKYLKDRKQEKHHQLFSTSPTGKYNDWSRNFTTRLNRYIRTYVTPSTKGRSPTSYSFRHTFADALNRKSVPEHIAAHLLGHKHEQITYGRYGSAPSLKRLKTILDRLE